MKKRAILFALLGILIGGGCVSCGDEVSSSSTTTPPTSITNDDIQLTKTQLIGLPGQTYEVEFVNNSGLQPQVQVSDFDLVNVQVKSLTKISISLLKEGTGHVKVGTDANNMKTLTIESISLEITNDTDHISVGESLAITLSKNVDAEYSIDNTDIATVDNGTITVLKEGTFTVTVKYGEIILTKSFDSFIRSNIINTFNRASIYVKYHGRNVHFGNWVKMNNTGSGFEVTFYGTKLSAKMEGWYGSWYGNTKIAVLVDGSTNTEERVVTIDEATTLKEYTLVEGLAEGLHTVKVLKITEAGASHLNLHEITTDGYFKPVDKTPRLKLEAYGDSITAGYGNLRGDAPDGTNANIQDGMQTYATYTATALNADINVQAKSGIGMYTAGNVDDNMQVNSFYAHVNYDGEYKWNLNNYTPDIVIINLGTNDHWNVPTFNEETFKTEYIKVVKSLASAYGKDTAFLLVSGLMEQKVDEFVQPIASTLRNEIENEIHTYQFEKCATGHPVKEEHKAASDKLVKYIKDNGLDVIHEEIKEDVVVDESGEENINVNIEIELQDEIPEYVDLYVKGLGDNNIKLTKESEFKYTATTNVKEGDYDVYTSLNIEGEETYYDEIAGAHKVQVRKDNSTISFVADTMVVPADPNPNADTYGWTMSTILFEGGFEAVSETSVAVTSNNWMAGFVTRPTDIGDNYRITAEMKVAGFTNVTNEFFGFAPYYVDDFNYIWTYIQFSSSGVLKSIGCTGAVNGKDIGFIDFWSFANISCDFIAGETLAVERHGTQLTIEFKGIKESQTIFTMNQDTKRVGVQCATPHTVTFTNYVQVAKDPTEEIPTWIQSPCSYSQTYEVINDNSVKLINYNNWLAGYIIQANPYVDNYTISATIKADRDNFVAANDTQIALVPYYQDANNNIVVYLQWDANGKLKSIGTTGFIGGTWTNWNDLWSFAGLDTTLTQGNELTVTRENTKIIVTFGGKTETAIFAGLDSKPCFAVGVWSHASQTSVGSYYSQFEGFTITEKA